MVAIFITLHKRKWAICFPIAHSRFPYNCVRGARYFFYCFFDQDFVACSHVQKWVDNWCPRLPNSRSMAFSHCPTRQPLFKILPQNEIDVRRDRMRAQQFSKSRCGKWLTPAGKTRAAVQGWEQKTDGWLSPHSWKAELCWETLRLSLCGIWRLHSQLLIKRLNYDHKDISQLVS